MIITVINVSQPEKVKTYYTVEVAYKDEKGKVGGRKIISFSYPQVYETVRTLQPNDRAEVTLEKKGDYWNWVAIQKLEEGQEPAPKATKTESFAAASNDRFESKEERAARQRLIVRQSSLDNAVKTLSVGAKSVSKEQVFELAEQYVDWVFEVKRGFEGISAMEDDFPL